MNQDGNKKTTEVDSLPVRAFKPRAAIHWARRIWHVSGVVVVALIFHEVSYSVAISLLATAVLFIAVPDILRLKIPALNRFVLKWFRMILRESEVNQISGVTYILLGMFIIAALFPKQVVEITRKNGRLITRQIAPLKLTGKYAYCEHPFPLQSEQ